jgi:hypothetical protein
VYICTHVQNHMQKKRQSGVEIPSSQATDVFSVVAKQNCADDSYCPTQMDTGIMVLAFYQLRSTCMYAPINTKAALDLRPVVAYKVHRREVRASETGACAGAGARQVDFELHC